MTLANILRQNLAETPILKERHELLAAGPDLPWSVNVTFDKRDELSGLAWEIAVTRTGPEPAGATIQVWAERIAQYATGLTEPLRIVEIDPERNEGFLRSAQPARMDDRIGYFEIFLKGTRHAQVRRYQASGANGKRTQTGFVLTHESLCKLVDDISGD
ncbi:MAG: hypothetical protein FJ271_10455 [Planctomycetes bacterium]|nr:hypothetical protein [Planctomycetota bacterium]